MFDFCNILVVENKSQEKKRGTSVSSKVREELGTVKINMDDTSIPGAQNPSRSPIRSPTCTRFETPDPPESRSVSSPCGPAPCWRPDSRSTQRPVTRTRSRRCTWIPGHWKNWAVGDQLKECQRKLIILDLWIHRKKYWNYISWSRIGSLMVAISVHLIGILLHTCTSKLATARF